MEKPTGWKQLQTSGDLLLALRERDWTLFGELEAVCGGAISLSGDLGDVPPSDLLNFLHQGRRTGVLLAREGGVERGIVLIEGNVAWACSTSRSERLGELLCRLGLAERARVDEALAAHGDLGRRPRRIGRILADAGVISEADLARGLRLQVVEIFLGLLVARSGSFVFLRGVEPQAVPAVLALDTQALLLDGLRRLDEMELYRTRIPSPGVALAATGQPLPQTDEITEAMRLVLTLLDGALSVEQIATASALGEFETVKAAYHLLGRGAARLA